MPIDYKTLPPNWKTEIRPAIVERAGNCCEVCGVANYAIGARDDQGIWHNEEDILAADFLKIIRIVLAVAHLDHDIRNNTLKNLRALCQRCHLGYNRQDNIRKRRAKRFKNQLKLFE
jgi:hypothetical protein